MIPSSLRLRTRRSRTNDNHNKADGRSNHRNARAASSSSFSLGISLSSRFGLRGIPEGAGQQGAEISSPRSPLYASATTATTASTSHDSGSGGRTQSTTTMTPPPRRELRAEDDPALLGSSSSSSARPTERLGGGGGSARGVGGILRSVQRTGIGGSGSKTYPKRRSWGDASSSASTSSSPRRKPQQPHVRSRLHPHQSAGLGVLNSSPSSNEYLVLRGSGGNRQHPHHHTNVTASLSLDDAALVESLGRDEENLRHEEIQKALKRHNVTLHQLNVSEMELYGRETEVSVLIDTYQSVVAATGTAAPTGGACTDANDSTCRVGIVNVVGKAGTGKTRLCQEFVARTKASSSSSRGKGGGGGGASTAATLPIVLSGKFDLQNRQEPYSGIQAALHDLPARIHEISDPNERARVLCSLREAVGNNYNNVRLVTSLVPDIEQVLQMVPPQPEAASESTAVVEEVSPTLGNAAADADSEEPEGGGTSDCDDDNENDTSNDFNDPPATRSLRLQLLFRNVIRALCSPTHPVILFLDDVQWSDSSSLSLIGSLLQDPRLSHLMLVTTCREEEQEARAVTTYHKLLNDVRGASEVKSAIRIESILLPLLNQEAVYSIVSTALRSSEERTFKLSEIVHQKSNGNPMYVIHFLIGLFEDGILRYNIGSMQWLWDELNVRSRFVTDNVVELAEARLRRLDASRQRVLMVAACLGQTFDPPKLEFVLDEPKVSEILPLPPGGDSPEPIDETQESQIEVASSVQSHLDALVGDAIIEYIAPLNTYCFIHDFIQQAAFDLIPEPVRIPIQCEVGRRLLGCEGPAALDDKYYFRAVELANVGVNDSTEDSPSRVSLAYVNDDAGQKAMGKAAYSAALKYFDAGMLWLGPDAWALEPALALDLSSGAVEAAFCSGDLDTMEERMKSVLDRDLPIEDKVRVYLIRISSYGVQYKHELCMEIAVKVLKEMGITSLPLRPRTYQVVLESLKTKFMLRNRTEESLTTLPLIQSKRWLHAMSITDMLQQIAYNSNQNLFAVMRLRSLRWTLKQGVCSYTPSLFAAYALLLCATGDIENGHLMGSAALSLSDSLHARSSRSKTIITVYGFVVHWASSLRTILKPLLYGHKLGLQTGEVEIAMHNLLNHDFALLATSATPLSNLVLRLRSSGQLMKDYGHEGIRVFSSMTLQFAEQLSVRSEGPPPVELSGDVIKESDVRAQFTKKEHALMIGFLDHYCLLLAYYFEDYDRANTYSEATSDYAKVAVCHFFVPVNAFFRGLTSLALAKTTRNRRGGSDVTTRRTRSFHLQNARTIIKQMKLWTERGNPNCIHMLQLLQAELASVTSTSPEADRRAQQLYLIAIASASRNAYLQDKALAHELAFKFHLQCHGPEDHFWAENHYKDSIQAYCDWNAFGKARHLVDTYGSRFSAGAGDGVSSFLDGADES